MGLWAKSVAIINSIREYGKQSIRNLADCTGFSKSSVHRHLQAMDRRDRYPESSLWETPEGRAWLIRLVGATLFEFGLKRGVGAETLSEFFSRLQLEEQAACSPNTLRTVLHLLERLILEITAAWEKDGIAHGEIRPVIGAVDETFLQQMMLVFMDLATGYVLVEEVAADRRYDTWFNRTNERLKTFGTEVLYMVSDRAKALIKLAHTGLGCPSIPDVFHLGHDLAKGYSLAIFGRLRQAKQALEQARRALEKVPKSAQTDPAQSAQARIAACTSAVDHSQAVEEQLRAELKAIETLLETNGLPMKQDILDKVRKQLAGISALVDFWWQIVRQDLTQLAMTPKWTQWAEELLLPLEYWHEQRRRTRHPVQKARIALVRQAVEEAFERHPCTRQLQPEVLAAWKSWAAEHAKAFQRASSAVEGRNGSLSQMQHNHRGLPTRRSQVWTALHNFDGRAADGTTPAARFFRRSFPDLFESVLSQIDELPMPRQRRQALAATH